MIRSFRNAATQAVFEGECPKGFPANILKVARRKLAVLDAAYQVDDLRASPGNKLHELKKDRKGQHAIWINDQYRVCFVWTDAGPADVEIIDYHD